MNIKPSYIGKVRDVYDLGDKPLISSSDRISAFDCVFKELVPGKGVLLNKVSNLWFSYFSNIPNHILETDYTRFPTEFRKEEFSGRAVLVKKCKRIDYECVVRGYLAGSGFKEYKSNGTIAGKKLPSGLLESSELDEPIFTPAIKNDSGHDENISEDEMRDKIGNDIFLQLKTTSIKMYSKARDLLKKQGVLLCDTKFEFGESAGKIILIDELLTPDSSRYWAMYTYKVGISPPSFDKQILRNYLESTNWNKEPPPPGLPQKLIDELVEKYKEIERKIRLCISEK